MSVKIFFLLYLCSIGSYTQDVDYKAFDDSILFKINWPGKDATEIVDTSNTESIVVLSENNEKYKCVIPSLKSREKDSDELYTGPSPLELLSTIFSQSSCTYRIETYWTYELCHGRHVRQYHEEREGKKVKLQEYYLGRWDKLQQEQLRQQLEREDKNTHIPVKKIDGSNLPYLQVNMTDGTQCDISAKPRSTKVLYVCYTLGKHEIYALKETSICEYEVVILSPLLCSHPRYRPKDLGENTINCHPLDGAAKKPKNLLQLEAESLKLRHTKANDGRVRVEIHPMELPDDGETSQSMSFSSEPLPFTDINAIRSFLSGKDCIQGGTGWWKYEFCYGKSVIQFHVEKDGTKTVINLGNFVKSGHLEWLELNPHKRPKPLSVRKHFSQFYTDGTICDKSGKPRHTEVKLKCLENNPNQGAVSLYLLEPKPCQYMLGVESQLICELLPKVNDDGLLVLGDEVGFSKSNYRSGYQPIEEKKTNEEKKYSKITLIVEEPDDLDNQLPDGGA